MQGHSLVLNARDGMDWDPVDWEDFLAAQQLKLAVFDDPGCVVRLGEATCVCVSGGQVTLPNPKQWNAAPEAVRG